MTSMDSAAPAPHRIPGTTRGGGAAGVSPPKPWERPGAASPAVRPSVGSPTSIPTSTSTTALTTTSTSTPRPPLRPWEQRRDNNYGGAGGAPDYGGSGYGRDPYYSNTRDRLGGYGGTSSYGGTSNYGSSYGSSYGGGYGSSNYGSSYGGGYGSSYGSSYGGGYGTGGYGRDRDYGYGGNGGYGGGYGGTGGYGRYDPYDMNKPPGMLANGHSFFNNLQYFVDSFARFSRLLDANYDAMHGSFASVVRLLEHMGRLNSEVMTVVKTFAVFRLLQSIVSRSMGAVRFLLLRRGAPQVAGSGGSTPSSKPLLDVHDFQDFARGGAAVTVSGAPQQGPPSWKGLVLVFLVTFVGLPMVVSKIFSLLSRRSALELEWNKEGRGEQVVALHDFASESPRELSFAKGDVLTVVNKFHPDWWEAAAKDGRLGIIPANHVENYVDVDAQPSPDDLKPVPK